MKVSFAVFCLLLSACAEPRAADIAIRGATVVDVASGLVVTNQTVLIAGNRIVAVGQTDEVRIAPQADVIDAAGGYLIPGLWDMHVHQAQRRRLPVDGHVPFCVTPEEAADAGQRTVEHPESSCTRTSLS